MVRGGRDAYANEGARGYLLLVVLDGELQPAQVHALLQEASLVHVVLAGRVVEDHFQLSRVPRLRQQVLGEHLALLRQLLVVVPKAKDGSLRGFARRWRSGGRRRFDGSRT